MKKSEIKSDKSLLSNTAKITIDKNLDKIKNVKFASNKIEEVNKVVQKLEVNF